MEYEEDPGESDTVLGMEWLNFPVHVSKRVFSETSNVLECSPSLSVVSRFLGGVDEFAEVTISLLGQGSVYKKNILISKFAKHLSIDRFV